MSESIDRDVSSADPTPRRVGVPDDGLTANRERPSSKLYDERYDGSCTLCGIRIGSHSAPQAKVCVTRWEEMLTPGPSHRPDEEPEYADLECPTGPEGDPILGSGDGMHGEDNRPAYKGSAPELNVDPELTKGSEAGAGWDCRCGSRVGDNIDCPVHGAMAGRDAEAGGDNATRGEAGRSGSASVSDTPSVSDADPLPWVCLDADDHAGHEWTRRSGVTYWCRGRDSNDKPPDDAPTADDAPGWMALSALMDSVRDVCRDSGSTREAAINCLRSDLAHYDAVTMPGHEPGAAECAAGHHHADQLVADECDRVASIDEPGAAPSGWHYHEGVDPTKESCCVYCDVMVLPTEDAPASDVRAVRFVGDGITSSFPHESPAGRASDPANVAPEALAESRGDEPDPAGYRGEASVVIVTDGKYAPEFRCSTHGTVTPDIQCPRCSAPSAGAGHTDTICLTGSTRFWDEYQELFRAFSLQGKIVLTVAFPTHQGGSEVTPEQKEILDELHLRKIDAADCVYVINVDGYIGESTANEIEYAEATGKRVYYHETPCAPGDTEEASAE